MTSTTKEISVAASVLYEKEKWYSNTAALSFGLFFLVVGVPIWWQTTTVYRAEMPYSEIKKAFQISPNLRINVEVVLVADDVQQVALARFGEILQDTFARMNAQRDYITVTYRGSLRTATQEEQDLLSNISSASDIDEFVYNPEEEKYVYYILKSKLTKDLQLPFINKRRHIFLAMPADSNKLNEVIPSIEAICTELFRPAALSRTFQAVHGAPLNDKELLRTLKFDSSYTIVLSLLVPEPDSVLASWDMSTAVKEYLSELQDNLLQHIDLKIKSQVLFYETLAIKPKQDKANEYYYITPEDMPHLINPIEARLGSFVDTNPTLNFIVYVPTSKQYPLYLHDEQGKQASSNSFLVPRWGGFYIYNVNTTSTSHPILHEVNMAQVVTELLPQIRALMGFTDLSMSTVVTRSPITDSSLPQWELDQWMRQRTIENIGTSTHALFSLSNLVQNIRNMVINDDISKQVTDSVNAIMDSYHHLNKGAIQQAFIASKRALKSADKAFFDTSLLELLYFPEDQKFAIYIPLFLPVGLPLIFSTIAAIKWFRGRTAKGSAEQEKQTKQKEE